MFKYKTSAIGKLTKCLPCHMHYKLGNSETNLEWIQAEEISLSCEDIKKPQTWGVLNFSGCELHYILPSVISSFVKNNKEILAADVIPAKYEGGLKVWDITHLVATLFSNNDLSISFKSRSVLDLGCGNGLIGILAMKLGADIVHFQDYNSDVIKMATIPTVLKNSDDSASNCKFFSGDWSSFSELNDTTYDIIVTNATIYSISSYDKLLTVFKKKLKRTGVVFVGAKTYYFGYGGGTRQFEEALEKDGTFKSEVKWTSTEGVQHEILEVTYRT